MIRSLPVVIAVAILLTASAAVPEAPPTGGAIVLMPFENASGADSAGDTVKALVSRQLANRGWKVIEGAEVEKALEENRIRYLDSLDPAMLDALCSRFNASAVLLGTVYSYREGDNSLVAFSVREIARDGRLVWGEVVGLSADDTEGMLGFGRAGTLDSLARAAVVRLMRHFPRPGANARIDRGPRGSMFRRPLTYRSATLEATTTRRVCIIPFESGATDRQAGRTVADILSIRLVATGHFEVVEPAVFRAAMRAQGIRSFRGMGSNELQTLGKKLGTTLFLEGSIYTYKESPVRSTRIPPELSLELSLVDVAAGRILWSGSHGRRGDDYIGFLMLGSISSVVTLTDHVISELIAAEESAKTRRSTATMKMKGQL